jgi:hypothetical protein
MSRDYRKLRVFGLADQLVLESYRVSIGFPNAERFGLQAQIRRAAGSATEASYLANVAGRLGLVEEREATRLEQGYSELAAGLPP